MNQLRRRGWLWCAILLVLFSGWMLCTPPGWYQPDQHVSGSGERFEQLVVDQLTTLRDHDQRWELSLDVASCNAFGPAAPPLAAAGVKALGHAGCVGNATNTGWAQEC